MARREVGADGVGDRPPGRSSRSAIADRLLVALIEGLTRLCERGSIDLTLRRASTLGGLWFALRGPRTRRVREALALALPELGPVERDRIAREVFVHLAQGLAELLLLRGGHREALLARVEVAGIEHLEAASRGAPGGGVLIVSAHLGNWELACAKAASIGLPLSLVYRAPRRAVLDRLLGELRGRAGREPGGVSVEQIRLGQAGLAAVRALRRGRGVLVLLDQNADREEGVFVRFFGRPACTRSGPVALAALRGVPIVPAFIRREPGSGRQRLEIQPALPLEAGAAEDPAILRRNVQRVTGVIEAAVRRDPGQWIWTHRRWRTRPGPGDPVEDGSAPPPGADAAAGAFAGDGARV